MGTSITKLCNPNSAKAVMPNEKPAEQHTQASPASLDLSKRTNIMSLDDFIRVDCIGEGGYGKVFLVKKKDNGKLYALKKVNKKLFNNNLRLKDAINEKNIMVRSTHPFIVKLYFTFQDKKNLYYCMEYVEGGVLFRYIREQGGLSELITKFYTAQVVMALRYLHEECKTMYRDLKPENLLLDKQGYLKVSDFGLSTSELSSGRGHDDEHMRDVRVHRARDHRRREVLVLRRLLESGELSRAA